MKGKKFFNTLAAKILVIALMLAATAGLVLGIFFLARPLNSGVRIGDALKGFSYEQTTAFGEKLAMDAINGVSEKDESLLFEKQGEYDGKQTVDITQLNAGIGCKSKNPATTYTLADLASMYNEGSQYEDFSGLFEDDGETDASYIEAQINDYGGGEVFYKDSQGNLYGSDYTLREFQDLDISMYMYRLTLDGDVVDIQQVEHVSLDDPTEIGINEVVIRLMLEEAGVDREMLDALDYSALDPSFAELYVRGRQYETKLPQSGETLGEYALQNPDKENLSDLYNSLLEAEARVGEYDSQANYIFFRGPGGLAGAVMDHGVMIRDCSNYRGLPEGYYRTAVRLHEENRKLIRAVRAALKDLDQKPPAPREIENGRN